MILTDKKLKTLVAVALFTLALAILLTAAPKTRVEGFTPGATLIQGLDPSAITKIELQKTVDGKEVNATIALNGEAFAVAQKNNYPADLEDVNYLLVQLLDIRAAEQPQKDLEKAADYGLDPKKPEGGMITLYGKDNKEIAKLLVGRNTAKGTFLSLGKEIYLSEKLFEFSAEAASFLNQSLIKADSKEIAQIEIQNGAEKYAFAVDAKAKDKGLQFVNMPADKEEDTNSTWGVKEGLGRVTFDDVLPAAEVKDFVPAFTATITLESSLKYVLEMMKNKDGKYLLRAKAIGPDRTKVEASTKIRVDSDKKELAEKDAVLTAVSKAKEFNEDHANWVYIMSEWQGQRLMTPLAKLLKDKPKPEPAKPAETAKPADAAKPAAEAAVSATPTAPAAVESK